MEKIEAIQPGLELENSFQVDEIHTASHVGSGAVSVLSTPSMIGFMERTSHQLLASVLPEGLSSVGVRVDISHLAPTPAGSTLKVRSEVTQVEGSQVSFLVEAWDDLEIVGKGTHLRVIIEQERFLRRVARKASEMRRD